MRQYLGVTIEELCLGMIISTMWQRKSTTQGPSYSATSTDASRLSKHYATKRLSGGIGSVHREEYQIFGERAATGCPLREEWLPLTQQCDHHAWQPELGDPCEQAGRSQARNVVPHYKQPSGHNNFRTHSHSYTHQRQHTLLLTTFHLHRSLQTLLSEHHQVMEQMHTTHNSTNANNHLTHLVGTCTQCLHNYIFMFYYPPPPPRATPPTTCNRPSSTIL